MVQPAVQVAESLDGRGEELRRVQSDGGGLGFRWFHVVVLVSLNVLDLGLTALVLEAGGRELNPLLAASVQSWVPVLVKAAVMFVVVVALLRCPRGSQLPDRVLSAVICIYALVVAWNMAVLSLG
ncbi:MAG: hypothetical protein JJLCMIEE_00947 [Acidimicrobiales bacterium]|nr:MAG: hypothetical protein EDR02_11230 [Actinomycetota bacterium]MBV6507889.1 hypothetical protein [Acidimicrobiales bacterium]RIK06033.1 MAG: hypothetical protein DCC48_08770 [Acidobacteriota bacterium]